jgi:hypothetical protein
MRTMFRDVFGTTHEVLRMEGRLANVACGELFLVHVSGVFGVIGTAPPTCLWCVVAGLRGWAWATRISNACAEISL